MNDVHRTDCEAADSGRSNKSDLIDTTKTSVGKRSSAGGLSPADAHSFWAAWRWWLPLALLALALAIVFVDPFAGDWDALDYTVLAVEGRASSMILGRTLFIFGNHALWRIAHALFALPPERAYLLFQYAVVAQSPLAVIAWWRLARDLTDSVRAATLSALLLALSPFYIIYSGQAMTEIPSLLLMAVALTLHLKGTRTRRAALVLAGAALLGLSVNLREAALLYAPWLVVAPLACGWKLGRREIAITALSGLVFLICAFGPFAFLLWSDIDNYRWSWHGWVESSRLESARHPVSLGNLLPLLRFFFIASPLVFLALPFAVFREGKARGRLRSPLLAFAAVGLIANLSLIMHYSVTINGRYMLTGLPALTPLVATYCLHSLNTKMKSVRRAFAAAVVGIMLVAVVAGVFAWPLGREYVEGRASAKDYRVRLALVPRDAVMISGGQTVAVTYWRGIGAGAWDVIGTGGGWPGAQLASVIETHLREGRRVFLDADPRWWSSHGWQQLEIHELVEIESQFRFRRVSETIYEIRPPGDDTARDQPNLDGLLRAKSKT
ncbi:MAG: glycosyltransferase family 39 protein [Pyrinomonadaceae bacterium]